jgi:hypothetical protein
MIIDDVHRVAFIHIPKCGGTSVSRQFGQLDSCGGHFRRKGEHPNLGLIHFAHIPLYYLKQEYLAEFEKIRNYRSFALLRDPHSRFASAVCQRLEEFGGVPPLQITSPIALREARHVMKWLMARDRFCNLEYIHFSRQADYVRLDGVQVASDVFLIENMAEFGASLGELCGITFDPERRDNTNFASSNSLLAGLRRLKPIYSRLTPWPMRERALKLLQRLNLQTPTLLYDEFRQDPEISAFVETYYAEDFALLKIAGPNGSASESGRTAASSASPAQDRAAASAQA